MNRPSRFCRRLAGSSVCLPALLPAWPALAQTPAMQPPGVSAAVILQMLLGLALIIGLLFFAAWFLRRLNGGRGFGNTGPLRVVGGLMIGTRERIVLLEVEDTWIVIGIVPGQIRTLHTLPRGEAPAAQEGEMAFAKWLRQIGERSHEKP